MIVKRIVLGTNSMVSKSQSVEVKISSLIEQA